MKKFFQSRTNDKAKSMEALIQSFCGSERNFGKEIKDNFIVVWDSEGGKKNIPGNDTVHIDYKKELSESLFIRCSSNFVLGCHFIESIEKDSLSKYLKLNIKDTISFSFYEAILARLPLLGIYNLDYLLGCKFDYLFTKIKPHLENDKFNKIASTILDISFTQIKACCLYFQFLKHVETYKKTYQLNKKIVSSLDLFYGVTDAEYALLLIKSLPEKILIAISIILDCEKRVTSANKTNSKINIIDTEIARLKINTAHWPPLKKYFHSDNLEDLNRFRTGILHANGVKSIDFTRCNHQEQMIGVLELEKILKNYYFTMQMCFIVVLMLTVDETIVKRTTR